MEGPINMGRTGCESIWCWINHVTFSHVIYLEIFKVSFLKSSIPGMGWPIGMGQKRCEPIESRMILNLDIQGYTFKKL